MGSGLGKESVQEHPLLLETLKYLREDVRVILLDWLLEGVVQLTEYGQEIVLANLPPCTNDTFLELSPVLLWLGQNLLVFFEYLYVSDLRQCSQVLNGLAYCRCHQGPMILFDQLHQLVIPD